MLSDDSVNFSGVAALISIGTQNYGASPLSRVAHLNFFSFICIFIYGCCPMIVIFNSYQSVSESVVRKSFMYVYI